MSKDTRLHFRLDNAAREKLREVCKLTGLDEATALRACIKAFIEYIEEHGEIRLPLAVVPKAKAQIPAPSFPSTARPAPGEGFSLSEPPPAAAARRETPAAQPRITKTRSVLRAEALKHKPQKS